MINHSKFDIIVASVVGALTILIVSISFLLGPNRTGEKLFYISTSQENSGCLMQYDFDSQTSTCLTGNSFNISNYLILNDTENPLAFFATTQDKNLYQMDLSTKKVEIISDIDQYSNYEFQLEPNQNNLLVWRTRRGASQSNWWRYNTQDQTWSIWRPGTTLLDLHFSPRDQSILANDVMNSLGYVLIDPDQNTIKPIGNYDRCFGFNTEGNTILCFTESAGQSIVTIYFSNGSSEEIVKDSDASIKEILWSNTNNTFYLIIERTDRQSSELLSNDLSSSEEKLLFQTSSGKIDDLSINQDDLLFTLSQGDSPNSATHRIQQINLSTGQLQDLNLEGKMPTKQS